MQDTIRSEDIGDWRKDMYDTGLLQTDGTCLKICFGHCWANTISNSQLASKMAILNSTLSCQESVTF